MKKFIRNVIARKPPSASLGTGSGLTKQSQFKDEIASGASHPRNDAGCRLMVFCLLICLLAAGCSPQWRGKFIQKKKGVSGPQPILTLQSNVQATHPPVVRYQEHFAYWKSWHSELLSSLGQIQKRDLAYLNGSIGELRSLAQLLSGPPSENLRGVLEELNQMEGRWEGPSGGWRVSSSDRTRLEQIERKVNRDFYYSKVKEWIPSGTN